jgi:hypothetical protein
MQAHPTDGRWHRSLVDGLNLAGIAAPGSVDVHWRFSLCAARGLKRSGSRKSTKIARHRPMLTMSASSLSSRPSFLTPADARNAINRRDDDCWRQWLRLASWFACHPLAALSSSERWLVDEILRHQLLVAALAGLTLVSPPGFAALGPGAAGRQLDHSVCSFDALPVREVLLRCDC